MHLVTIALISKKARRLGGPFVLMMLLCLSVPQAQAQTPEPDASVVAYVAAQAAGPGKRGDAARPYASLQQALDEGARTLRVTPGVYVEERLYVGGGEVVQMQPWNRRAEPSRDGVGVVEIRGTIIIDEAATLRLGTDGPARATVRVLGDVLLPEGTLDLRDAVLEIGAPAGATAAFFVGSRSAVHAADACDDNLVRYIGDGTTEVVLETTDARLRVEMPCIEIDLGETGRVSFDASGLPATTRPPAPPDRLDVLATPRFTLLNAPDSAGVRLLGGRALLDIAGPSVHQRGGLMMAGRASAGPELTQPTQPTVQTVRIGGPFAMDDGAFLAMGGAVEVGGPFFLGKDEARTRSQAHFSLAPGGLHTVKGPFGVGPNINDCSAGEVESGARACTSSGGSAAQRNRYALGGGQLILYGDYRFEGTGDRFDDALFDARDQGLDGTVVFAGDERQAVLHRQDEDAHFEDVVLTGEGGIRLQSDGWQSSTGTLSLQQGLLDTDDKRFDWIILNTGFETDLAERHSAASGNGVIELGSAQSFIEGEVDRVIEHGSLGTSSTEGYLFPVGTRIERFDGYPDDAGQIDYFRPLILHFPDDLGHRSLARVQLREDLLAEDMELPDEGIVVDASDGIGTLTLDLVGDLFWQLEFDGIPSFDPSIRVVADGLFNVFDIEALRLMQWDCDGRNPRLAGFYELPEPPLPNRRNAFIDGVPDLRQKYVDVEACQIFGIASNFLINPLNVSFGDPPFVWVQFIHGARGIHDVDIYIDDVRWLNHLDRATPYFLIPRGLHKIDVVAGDDPDNSEPLWTTEITFVEPHDYVFVTVGNEDSLGVVVKDDARREAASDDLEFFFIHDVPDAPVFDLLLIDPFVPNQLEDILLNNFTYGAVSTYRRLEPRTHEFRMTNADNTEVLKRFFFELEAFRAKTFTFLFTGRFDDRTFTVVGYDAQGRGFFQRTINITDAEAVPEAFALRGNHPNPFNPITRITFDLPEPARVHVEIVDLLGRTVRTTPAQRVEAGAGRTVAVEAAGLASGVYLYRVVAQTVTATRVRTGRMILAR